MTAIPDPGKGWSDDHGVTFVGGVLRRSGARGPYLVSRRCMGGSGLATWGYPGSGTAPQGLRINLTRAVSSAVAFAPFALALCVLVVPGAGGVVKVSYPLLALLSGSLLYLRFPILYVGFVWWVWLLTPGMRRLVDYYQGWDPQNVMMLAPFLVTLLVSFSLLKHLPKLQLQRYLPFGLVLASLLYGYAVGVMRGTVPAATFALLDWLVPALFAFYLAVNWRRYALYREVVRRVFTWGVVLLGCYGLVQYLNPLPWDRYWMLSAPIESIGLPEPFGVRVFSTLNSPGPFAVFVMAGLLLLLNGRGSLRWPASAAGLVVLLLSLVRSAWGGWIVGFLYVAARTRRLRLRLLLALAATIAVAAPLLLLGPVAETVGSRVSTLSDPGEDTSFAARAEFYSEFAPRAFLAPVGEGMGGTGLATKLSGTGGELGELGNFDSGVMNIPLTLGWPGTVFYVGALALLLQRALGGGRRPDPFATASQGIVLAILAQLVFDDFLVGVTGMVFWSFLGFSLAARSYHTAREEKAAAAPARRSPSVAARPASAHGEAAS